MRRPKVTHAELIHEAAQEVFDRYVDHCSASISKSLVHDQYGCLVPPDQIFLEQVENEISIYDLENISDVATQDFRRSVAAYVGNLVLKGVNPSWSSNPSLKNAIIKYLIKYCPSIMETPIEQPKYRRITDPWEPAW